MQTELETARFSIFSLDTRRRELLAHGVPVALHARAFDVLVFLIANRDRSVSHADILAHVWEGRAVSDNNLSVQLSSLRKALAEAGAGEKLIVTLPNRRYRFLGALADAPAASQAREPWAPDAPVDHAGGVTGAPARPRLPALRALAWLAAACCFAGAAAGLWAWRAWPAAAPRLSIAVLPFRNMSPDRSQDYLADAITDDLTADLAHIPASTVIARESADAVRHERPQQIGRDLGVRYIVDGSIAPEDNHYHILATLIDAASGRQIWTTQFDPARDRLSEVRPTIVRRIAGQLDVAVDRLESAHTARGRPDDSDALDLFFQARSVLDARETLVEFRAAHILLRRAIAMRLDFSDAQAELGWILLREITTLSDPDEATDLAEAREAIRQALDTSPQNTLAIAARALDQEIAGDCVAAQQNAARALDLQPSSLAARRVLASCAQRQLRFDDAIQEYNSILELNPASPNNTVVYLIVGTLHLMQGHVGDAIRYLTLAKDDDAPPSADLEATEQAELLLIAAHGLAGDRAQAKADYEAYARKFSGRSVWRIGAYFDAAWRREAGLKSALGALHDAGMPLYSDEAEAGTDTGGACPDGAFAPTPAALPEGTVLATADFARALGASRPPLVIDVGLAIVAAPGWVIFNRGVGQEDAAGFAVRAAADRLQGDLAAPIAVLGEGVRGCPAYRAAVKLTAAGYKNVQWYRGGEEAWQKHLSHGTLAFGAAPPF